MNFKLTRSKGTVKFKKIFDKAIIPQYTTTGSAGLDFHALYHYVIEPGEVYLVRTGLSVQLEEGTCMSVRPRSGISKHFPNYIANAPGTIDSDYRGEIKALIVNNTDQHWHIASGDRIFQGVIEPILQPDIVEVETLDKTERGSGGFGSTGR